MHVGHLGHRPTLVGRIKFGLCRLTLWEQPSEEVIAALQ